MWLIGYKKRLTSLRYNPINKICLILLILIHFSGCDFIYRILQREGAQERDILGDIIPTQSNPKVIKVQRLLKLYGYKVGHADGILGAHTRNAIVAFQKDNDIKPSRFVDKATWEKLHELEYCGLVFEGEVNITTTQKALKEAGFDPGPIDGKRGRRTDVAIKAFQKEMGLVPDGKIGLQTLKALAVYLPQEETP